MLNAKALRASKECIQLVKRELGIRLTLSNPDFLLLLKDSVEQAESEELHLAYHNLLSLAGGAEVVYSLKQSTEKRTFTAESTSEQQQEQAYIEASLSGAELSGGAGNVENLEKKLSKLLNKKLLNRKLFKGFNWGQAS